VAGLAGIASGWRPVTAFDEATAVRRCGAAGRWTAEDSAAGVGRATAGHGEPVPGAAVLATAGHGEPRRETICYEAWPDERFAIAVPGAATPPAVNGGVLVATLLRAVLDTSPHPYPVATSAHFLRVASLAPARIEVDWLKQGGTAATARAALLQDGKPVLDVTVTTGALPAGRSGDGELSWTGEPPRLPPIEKCVRLGPWPTAAPRATTGYAAQVDLRMDPATTGWRQGKPAGVPEMRGYFRLREHRDPDAYLLALAVDGLPPVIFGLGAAGWSPTVELTWHMRAVPAPGVLRVATRCRHVSGGWFDEEAEVWDAAGRLVAQSRQLARVGRSSAGTRPDSSRGG
jgi:acyl-CoA thioesterase